MECPYCGKMMPLDEYNEHYDVCPKRLRREAIPLTEARKKVDLYEIRRKVDEYLELSKQMTKYADVGDWKSYQDIRVKRRDVAGWLIETSEKERTQKASGNTNESFLLTHYIAMLKEHIIEEEKDSALYSALAVQAEKLNRSGEAMILRTISNEEKNHHLMLQRFLKGEIQR